MAENVTRPAIARRADEGNGTPGSDDEQRSRPTPPSDKSKIPVPHDDDVTRLIRARGWAAKGRDPLESKQRWTARGTRKRGCDTRGSPRRVDHNKATQDRPANNPYRTALRYGLRSRYRRMRRGWYRIRWRSFNQKPGPSFAVVSCLETRR